MKMKLATMLAIMSVVGVCFSGCNTTESLKPEKNEYSFTAYSVIKEKENTSSNNETESPKSHDPSDVIPNTIPDKIETVTQNSKDVQTSKEESNIISFETISLGKKIKTSTIEMDVTECKKTSAIYPSNPSGYYSYYPDKENESYIYLSGTIKNIGADSLSVDRMHIQTTLNNKYNYTGFLVADDGDDLDRYPYLKPFSSTRYYIIVSVPDEIANTFSTCRIRFGFTDDFDLVYRSDFSDCENRYELWVSQ